MEKAEKLQAFVLFQEKGMKAVEQLFPRQVAFVREHRTLNYRAVKELLFSNLPS